MHAAWHEETFEKVKFEPKPREFLPQVTYLFHRVWSDREITRKTLRIFFWGCCLYLLTSSIVISYGEDLMSPRASHIMHRISAGLFLLAVVGNFIYEFGWRGGGKEINKSHM